jgi:hypothetical protein
MIFALAVFGMINQMWYAVPLIVVVSLVYSATRHEAMRPILQHAVRLAWSIVIFMGIVLAVLAVLSWIVSS